MDRFIKIATIPLLIAIAVMAYMTMRPDKPAAPPGSAAEQTAPPGPADETAARPAVDHSSTEDDPVVAEVVSIETSAIQVDLGAADDRADTQPAIDDRQHPAAQGPYVPLGQIERRGAGPINMILIAGNGETWEIWDAFMDRNADRYTMWAVTLPGFGGGPLPPIGLEDRGYLRQPWLKNAGRAIAHLITSNDIEEPVLMGHQIGGQLAVYISLVAPDIVGSVISLDGEPAFILGEPTWRPTIQDRIELVTTQMAPQLGAMNPGAWSSRQHFVPETYIRDKERGKIIGDMIAEAPMEAMHQYIKEFALADLTKPLAKAETPILFVAPFYRVEDETFRTDREVRWFDMLADAPPIVQHVFFYDSSSWITEDQPEYLDEAVRAYLAGEEVVGSPEFDPFAEDAQAPDDQ